MTKSLFVIREEIQAATKHISSPAPRTGKDNDWPEPEPLPDRLPSVQPFNPDYLPEVFRPWIMDISDRMQCPPDYPAVGAIVSLASIIGRKIGIRPKRHDDWLVVPNLWGAAIGRPGIMKSPALDQAMFPLKRLAVLEAEEGANALKEWKSKESVRETRKKILAEKLKKTLKGNGEADTSDLEKEFSKLDEESPLPTIRRYSVNDSTVEKLGEVLRENPNGVLVFRDELTGWLRSLDREGHENDRAFYLEAWNGTGSYTCDRIGRGTVHIPAVCLSILGGIQPGPFGEYVREASRNGSGADGLLQRFQLLVWPDDPKDWKNVDRWPDTTAKNRAFEVFRSLDCLDPRAIGAEQEGEEGVPFVRFTPEAQKAFDTWREILETQKLRSGEPEVIEAALSKYRSMIPSLSLIFHLVDIGSGAVGLDALLRTMDWADYLESHMRRIYSAVSSPNLTAAHSLLQKIQVGKIIDKMTLREIYLKGWSGIDQESLEKAIDVLDEFGWARTEIIQSSERGGRPTSKIRINPKIGGTR